MNETPAVAALLEAVEVIPPGRVLAAVSGGPDSVALLRALHDARRDIGVAHVNHGLRGEDSDEDEAFVRALAAELKVPVFVTRVDTPGKGARGASLEADARRLRYGALDAMLAGGAGDFIATGHTQDDQAETLLLNLLRGSGLTGLRGMGTGQNGRVRPFLSVPRATILRALEEWHQPYRLDNSNDDPRFTRNRLRAEVVPLLAQFNPRVVDSLARTARRLRDDADFVVSEADRAVAALVTHQEPSSVTISRAGWAALHPALASVVARRLIRMILGDVLDIDERHIAAITAAVLGGEPMTTNLPRDLHLDVRHFLVTLRVGTPAAPVPLRPATLDIPGTAETEAGTLTGTLLEALPNTELDRMLTVAGPFHALCDADLVGGRVCIRSRHPGDRIQPAGGSGTRKVQDVMVDARVPRSKRDRIPVVHTESHIVWIPGLALDRRAAASPETRHILHLVWRPNS